RNVSMRPGERGVSELFGTLSSGDGQRLAQRLAQVVGWMKALGDDRPKSVLRSVALGMLADPGTVEALRSRVHALTPPNTHTPQTPQTPPAQTPPPQTPPTPRQARCPPPRCTCTSTASPGVWTATAR